MTEKYEPKKILKIIEKI
jgi:hypothetical protein